MVEFRSDLKNNSKTKGPNRFDFFVLKQQNIATNVFKYFSDCVVLKIQNISELWKVINFEFVLLFFDGKKYNQSQSDANHNRDQDQYANLLSVFRLSRREIIGFNDIVRFDKVKISLKLPHIL